MKTQAWGWLTVAVLAAGINSSYHEGGMQWAHEIADRVQHNTGAVLALATGRADQFLAEARMLKVNRAADADVDIEATADNDSARCPFSMAVTRVQRSLDESQSKFDRFQALSDREEARLARVEAYRARVAARIQSKLARVQSANSKFHFSDASFTFADNSFTPVVVNVPQIRCQHVRVSVPRAPRVHVRIPRVNVPTPVVEVDSSDQGPI